MRIALVHSYYSSRQPSGENVVVDAQAAALSAAGHEVLVVARRTDERERRRMYPLAAAWTVASGHGPDPTDELRRFRPDVVHVHNLFPNFGTRWLADWPGPVVATLHNFRPMCAAGTLYRDGRTCTECPDGDPSAAVKHRCYRGSRTATLPVAIGRRHGVLNDPLVHRADALVVLTEAARTVYRTYGVDAARLHVLPNFVDDPYGRAPHVPTNGRWLYVGRLSPEKGVEEMMASWPDGVALDIFGSGPLSSRLMRLGHRNVHQWGDVPRCDLRAAMPNYEGLVVPSRWFEGLPTVMLEGWAAGLPILAVDGSSVAALVHQAGAGVTVRVDADREEWSSALDEVRERRGPLSSAARSAYERLFTLQGWATRVDDLYMSLVDRVGLHA